MAFDGASGVMTLLIRARRVLARAEVREVVVYVRRIEADPCQHRDGGSRARTAVAVHEQRLVTGQAGRVHPDSRMRKMECIGYVTRFELGGSPDVEQVRAPAGALLL
jgi:hypothetical protein